MSQKQCLRPGVEAICRHGVRLGVRSDFIFLGTFSHVRSGIVQLWNFYGVNGLALDVATAHDAWHVLHIQIREWQCVTFYVSHVSRCFSC